MSIDQEVPAPAAASVDAPLAPVEARSLDDVFAALAGLYAALAGVIHLVAAPHHLRETPWIGVLFVLLGVGQLALAASFHWRLRPAVLVVAFAVHVVVVTLYVLSRTVELPFLPPHDAGHSIAHLPVGGGIGNGIPVYPGSRIEPVGALDLLCLVAELVLLAMLVALAPARARRSMTTVAAVVGVGVVVTRLAWLNA